MTRYAHRASFSLLRGRFAGRPFWLLQGTLYAALLALPILSSHPLQAQKSRGAGKPSKGSKQPPARREPLAQKGHTLFVQNCSPCHGANAQGGEGPDLHGLKLSDSFITTTVKNGRGDMPAFGAKLKDADIKALAAYLRSLKK